MFHKIINWAMLEVIKQLLAPTRVEAKLLIPRWERMDPLVWQVIQLNVSKIRKSLAICRPISSKRPWHPENMDVQRAMESEKLIVEIIRADLDRAQAGILRRVCRSIAGRSSRTTSSRT